MGYTAANACLRAVAQCDPIWVSTVKAFPTVALFGPVVLLRLMRRTEMLPPRRALLALTVTAVICQLFGNVVFQWALGVIGMALAVPLTLGTMIFGAALMGRIFLHEAVTFLMACSLVILVTAVGVLSAGAGDVAAVSRTALEKGPARSSASDMFDAPQATPLRVGHVMLGVGAACGSGVAYALLGVVIRSVVTNRMSVLMTLVMVTLVGVLTLGPASLGTLGLSGITSTAPDDFGFMMLAGIFNAVAFLALTKALQLVPVVYVNALNATQATMGALAGVWIFAEPSSWWLWLGVALTAVGLLLMRRPRRVPLPTARTEAADVSTAAAAPCGSDA